MYSIELAEELGSTKPTISNYLSYLKKTKLIERTRRDKRQFYSTTEKGEEYLETYQKLLKLEEVREQ